MAAGGRRRVPLPAQQPSGVGILGKEKEPSGGRGVLARHRQPEPQTNHQSPSLYPLLPVLQDSPPPRAACLPSPGKVRMRLFAPGGGQASDCPPDSSFQPARPLWPQEALLLSPPLSLLPPLVSLQGPPAKYHHLTREELLQLLLRREAELVKKEQQVQELESYIDRLLVRIMEQSPTLLQIPLGEGAKATQ